jgi:citrate synthase
MVFFLLKGRRPTPAEADLLRAVIVSHISHGITGQSSLAVMEAADCRSGFLHAAIAGFSVGAGVFHQGGLAATMDELVRYAAMSEQALTEDLEARLRRRERIMGFGHRFHKRDPRAATLMEIAGRHGFSGPHIRTVQRMEGFLRDRKGIAMNIEAAGGSILLDLGIEPTIAHLVILVGRSPMYAALYLERLGQGRKPFQRIEVFDVIEEEHVPDA